MLSRAVDPPEREPFYGHVPAPQQGAQAGRKPSYASRGGVDARAALKLADSVANFPRRQQILRWYYIIFRGAVKPIL